MPTLKERPRSFSKSSALFVGWMGARNRNRVSGVIGRIAVQPLPWLVGAAAAGGVLGILRNLSLVWGCLWHQETRHSSHLSGSLVSVNYCLPEKKERGESPLSCQNLRAFSDLVSLEQGTMYRLAVIGVISRAKGVEAQAEESLFP